MADNRGQELHTANPSSNGVKRFGRGLLCAVIAGFFAALAAVFAKLFLNKGRVEEFVCSDYLWSHLAKFRPYLQFLISKPDSFLNERKLVTCENVGLLVRTLGITLIFICNAFMFRFFSKSLLLCSSTAEATTANTAANFCFSALFGWLLFGEKFSLNWCFGTSLILLGLAIINKGRKQDAQSQEIEENLKLHAD